MNLDRRPPQWVFWVRRAAVLGVLVVLLMGIAALVSRCGGEEPEPSAHVGQSRPVELRIPAIGLDAEFEAEDCRVKGGALNPRSMTKACAYTSPDKPYELPGPGAGDLTVIAGHTGAGVPGVFDALYDSGADVSRVSVGDTLYLRTEDSADAWLKYEATDVHAPQKAGLAGDASIWGTGPMPGRLLTISCIQPPNLLADAVRNAVVGWQFVAVVPEAELLNDATVTNV
ncbi:hypothetical protein [Corynebacterium sp. HMSC071B10]|uniref:hypothetical protein n=1 Tax=Corynebacterium sp. HMSC071B10 TaxID=1739494 RepID=UPI0008A51E20|nr:hypothetical protein [Corynebacterium sp. HMSC071B10]OFP35418.1 hypothetical protein HMPREF2990_08945 [Corynebacterium sp. HMSC071B10]